MRPAVVLDIGSSKIVCLSGSATTDGGVVVHGVGIAPYSGYRDDGFVDKESLHEALLSAIEKAEQESCMRIRDVALTVPAGFAHLNLTDATLALGAKPRVVHALDVDKLISVSLKKRGSPSGFVLMHSTPVFFMADGVSGAEVPEGVPAAELSALVSHMYVREDYIRSIAESLDSLGVEISFCMSAALGEAVMLIPESDRVRPCVLIDIGHLQTDICVVENAAITAMSTLPVGGYHFSSDLAFGLEVPFDAAEQIKRRFAFSLGEEGKPEIVRNMEGSRRVSYSAISFIMEARARDLASLIMAELSQMGISREARPIVHLSGGGILMLKGGLDFLKTQTGLNLKRDMPWTPRLSTPNYCSAFGALDFVLRQGGRGGGEEKSPKENEGAFKKLLKFLTE